MRTLAFVLVALVLLLPSACAAPAAVDGGRMLERVRHQCAGGPRTMGSPSHDATRDWIAAELARLGGAVERQSFTDTTTGHPVAVTNLIGRFGAAGARRIVLCGHYDSRPWCDEDRDPKYHEQPVMGANDGGSSVAVLLELAELMHARAPKVGVDLVFFDAEDMGTREHPDWFCLGSRGYAARLPAPGDPRRPSVAFLFDMVGGKGLGIYTERNSSERAANLVALVGEAARAVHATAFHDEIRWTLIDDHIPLNDAGLPAIDIVDFGYPFWHTHQDTPDQLSPASLSQVARVAAWLVYSSSLTHT
jgi:hypothetical protein